MTPIEKGKNATMMSMTLFFILGLSGIIVNDSSSIVIGFTFAIVSAVSMTCLTVATKGEKK